jgi:N-acetylglutamate synthase-like GNAT family acetyltransferase
LREPARSIPKLIARPLRPGERDAMAQALVKSALPADDLDQPDRLFWRFETLNQLLAGYGGLEIHGDAALLRSVLILPPLRGRGMGRAIVIALETEAALHHCKAVHLLTRDAQRFFESLGYAKCPREQVPDAIRGTRQFTTLCPATADVLIKRIG